MLVMTGSGQWASSLASLGPWWCHAAPGSHTASGLSALAERVLVEGTHPVMTGFGATLLAADLNGGGTPAGLPSPWFYGFLTEFLLNSEQGFGVCGLRRQSLRLKISGKFSYSLALFTPPS